MIPNSTTGQASEQAAKSLPEVYASILVPKGGSAWRRMFAFFGPGYLVAVGYMDPGNWATALAGGASFGYTLLAVALLSNLMAIILQSLCARLGIGAGRDLAQACRDYFPKPVAVFLWILAEAAIIATDLAEVIGTAIGLNLLFDIPIQLGVIVTAFDVFLILMLQRLGFRWIEAFIISLSVVITACFAVQLGLAQPEFAAVMSGFIPRAEIITNPQMLYIALGILGATVMPHNLYLHSAIVQTRAVGDAPEEKRSAIRFATVDSTIALLFALFTNASILILSAAAFHQTGHAEITDLREAHTLLSPLLGTSLAATLFAVALLCCGLNSTVTATMAGQVVMEGFINVRLPPWLRRLVTRLVAIIPAIAVLMIWGEEKTGELLVLSQVILSLQLPFAIIPLVMFTASKKRMGALVAPRGLSLVAALIAVIIVALNVKMLIDVMSG